LWRNVSVSWSVASLIIRGVGVEKQAHSPQGEVCSLSPQAW
jgi:hypothetical protein